MLHLVQHYDYSTNLDVQNYTEFGKQNTKNMINFMEFRKRLNL